MTDYPAASLMSLPAGYRAVVVGAGGGIGGAVAAALAADARCGGIYALSRRGDAGPDGPAPVVRLAADSENAADMAAAAAQIGAEGPVHLIFVATGMLHRAPAGAAGAVQPEKSWRALTAEGLAANFAANAAAPMLALHALVPLLPRDQRALVGVLGARVGSIGDNRLGGWYGYRAAKAALAMLLRCLAIELARTHGQLAVLMLHPGTVDTPLSQPFQRGVANLLTPAASAAHLLGVLDAATPAQSGSQLDWRGELVAP